MTLSLAEPKPPTQRAPRPLDAGDTLVEVLRSRAQAQPERLALYELVGMREARAHMRYRDLDLRARAVAAALQQRAQPGQRVLLVMGNDTNYIVGFLACAYAGCVAVNLLPPSRPKHVSRLAHVAQDCDARVVLTAGRSAGTLARRLSQVPELAQLTWLQVDAIPDAEAQSYRAHSPRAEALCYLQYTSGSTAAPRGVMVSHGNLVGSLRYMGQLFDFTPQDKTLFWAPLYHDMGLIVGVLQPLFSGFPVALSDPMSFIKRPARWLRAIAEEGVTFAGGPNFLYDLCVDAVDLEELEGVDLSGWEIALNSSEHIRSRTLRCFAERFAPLGYRAEAMHTAYGLAEFTLAATIGPRGQAPVELEVDAAALARSEVREAREGARSVRLVSSGRLGAGHQLRVVEPSTGAVLPPGRVGEICLSGPCVTGGYWHNPEATEAAFGPLEGARALRTGDLGFVADGELYITGRCKDLIIVRGENRYPHDIEETVEQAHPAIRPHFVAAFAEDDGAAERLVVVAELAEVEGVDLEAVADAVFRAVSREQALPLNELHLAHRKQVPKTTSGKVQRRACQASLRAGELALHASFSR